VRFVFARRSVHRIPLPTLVTTAKRPSGGAGWPDTITFFRKTEVKFSGYPDRRRDRLELFHEIKFFVQANSELPKLH
jgi:hypothetical protein